MIKLFKKGWQSTPNKRKHAEQFSGVAGVKVLDSMNCSNVIVCICGKVCFRFQKDESDANYICKRVFRDCY